MKRHLMALMALMAWAAAWAEIPAGYYTSIDGKKDAELKKAVYLVIRNLTGISSYSALPQYFQSTDVYPGGRRWWDMYSDIPLYAPSFSGLNREHSFPKSWWGGSTSVNAYTDLNHLYPAEAAANMAKSNYPLGEVDTRYALDFDNGMTRVGYAVAGQGGGAKYVFEPDDEYKGDFARTYFYMVTCYQDYTWAAKYSWMLQQNAYPTLSDWAIQLLLRWHRQDPVSQKEIDRNEQVYRFQNNRNPFIDFPSLAEYIWGSRKGEAFSLKDAGGDVGPVGDPTLITPVQDMALDFGEVALGSSATAQLYFKGENLTNSLTIRIYSGDKDMFKPSVSVIPSSSVNSNDGYWLTVTYTPTAVGGHQSRLLISDGGLTGSRGVNMVASCQPVPTLNACTALPASDITDDSYLASWTTPDDVVDYYIVTRTRYVGGQQLVEEIVAEENELVIEGFGQSDSESYSVRSCRLGYSSPESNVVFVSHSGITGVEAAEPIAVSAVDGGILIECSAPQTGCRVYDPSGRLAAQLPQIGAETVVQLGPGVYYVITDQCRRPARVAIY